VCVSVLDTGSGLAPEVKPLIFERFYQDPNTVDNRRKVTEAQIVPSSPSSC